MSPNIPTLRDYLIIKDKGGVSGVGQSFYEEGLRTLDYN